MNVLVVGATRETGKRIVQKLVDRQIPVRAMVRNFDLAKSLWPTEVEIVVGDVLQSESLKAAISG